MGRNYTKAQLDKYRAFLTELESKFVGANNEVEFNLHRLIKEHQVSSCLTTMFIKLGYVERVSSNKFRILQAHAFQSMARNPEEALKLVTSYNYVQKLQRSGIAVPDSEPKIVETPFEEETEVPDEVAEQVFMNISKTIKKEAEAMAVELTTKLGKAVREILSANFDDAIVSIRSEAGIREGKIVELFHTSPFVYDMRKALLPGCLRHVEKVFLLGIKELGKLKTDGDTNQTT